jgi:hypothetical protein
MPPVVEYFCSELKKMCRRCDNANGAAFGTCPNSRHDFEPSANCEVQSILLKFVCGIAVSDWAAQKV